MTDELKERLQGLPELVPPADAWARIDAQVRRDQSRRRRQPARPALAIGGLLVLVALAAVDNWPRSSRVDPQPSSAIAMRDLGRLQAHSRALEAQLRSLPARPQSLSAQTAAVIGQLEDHIAVLDHQLMRQQNVAGQTMETPLWQQRVSLMNELVRARYREIDANAL